MLACKNIKKIYALKNSPDVCALNNVSLEFNNTGLVFILGKSGSGKTTLLNILSCLDKPDEGEVIYNGVLLKDKKNILNYQKNEIGFVFQEFNLIDELNVEENISLLDSSNSSSSIRKEKIKEILKKVGLEGYEKRKVFELSGGEKQRVGIARSLYKDAKILFADEPTGSVDSKNREEIFTLFKNISSNCLVIIVSHDEEASKKYADRIINIEDGQIVLDKTINPNYSKKNVESVQILKKRSAKTSFLSLLKLAFKFNNNGLIRNIIVSILLFICFTGMLGFVNLINFNYEEYVVREFAARNYNEILINKTSGFDNAGAGFTYEDELYFKDKLDIPFFQTYDTLKSTKTNISLTDCLNKSEIDQTFGQNSLVENSLLNTNSLVYLDENTLNNFTNYTIEGSFPKKRNEIMLTDFSIFLLNNYNLNLLDDNFDYLFIEEKDLTSDKFIGNYMVLGDESFKVTGILNSGIDFNNKSFKYYDLFNGTKYEQIKENKNYANFDMEYLKGFPTNIFISKEMYQELSDYDVADFGHSFNFFIKPDANTIGGLRFGGIYKTKNQSNLVYFNKEKTSLDNDEIILQSDLLNNILIPDLSNKIENNQLNLFDEDRKYKVYSLINNNNSYSIDIKEEIFLKESDYFNNHDEAIFEYALKNIPENNRLFDEYCAEFYDVPFNEVSSISNELKAYLYFEAIKGNIFYEQLDDTFSIKLKKYIDFARYFSNYNYFLGRDYENISSEDFIQKYVKYFGYDGIELNLLINFKFFNQKNSLVENIKIDKNFKLVGYSNSDYLFYPPIFLSDDNVDDFIKSYNLGNSNEAYILYDDIKKDSYLEIVKNSNLSSPINRYYYSIYFSLYFGDAPLFDVKFSCEDFIVFGRIVLIVSSILSFFLILYFVISSFAKNKKQIGILLTLGLSKKEIYFISFLGITFLTIIPFVLSVLGGFLVVNLVNTLTFGRFLGYLSAYPFVFNGVSILLILVLILLYNLILNIYFLLKISSDSGIKLINNDKNE